MNKTKLIFCFSFLFFLTASLYPQNPDSVNKSLLPDSLVQIDSIKISGNKITEDYIILRELTFKTGDTISVSILDYNKERVFSLGLFNDVQISYKNDNGRNKVLIQVVESWYIYPIPFIRYKDREKSEASYGINLLFKNFRGRDQTIRVGLSFGYDPSVVLMYNIPVLFNSKNLGIGFIFNHIYFRNKTDEGVILNNGDFDYKGIQAHINLNYRINQFNLLVGIAGFDYFEAPHKKFTSITSSKERIDRVPLLGFDYFYDSRDLKQFAAEGTYMSFLLIHKGFSLAGVNYNLVDLDYRRYRNILGDLTWKGRIKTRSVIGDNIPLYDYSLLGYDEYIRGTSRRKYDGKSYLLTSMELSYPLVKEWDMKFKLPLIPKSLTSARIGIQFNIFADAGCATNGYSEFSIRNFTYGWGFGINILLLPYNGFRIEYAFDKNMNGEVLIASGFSF